MSGSSAFETNTWHPNTRLQVNPEDSTEWEELVQTFIKGGEKRAGNKKLEPELANGFNHMRLCGMRRWQTGKDEVKGSDLHLEHFLHFRALIRIHNAAEFPLRDLVESKYADAAEHFLGNWQDFDNYISQVSSNDPGIDVDNLGLFAGAKLVQNQVLLDPYLGISQNEAESFDDSTLETPLKKRTKARGIDFGQKPPDSDAADEQIVNEALISFASALTRRFMVEKTPAGANDIARARIKGSGTVPTHAWKTVGDWTMVRDRFHIRERIRGNDPFQKAHMRFSEKSQRKDKEEELSDGEKYGRVLTNETDGSLYCIEGNATEILAIVEAKKRMRNRNRLKIEWQEAAEILAWLNLRLREEVNASVGKGKGNLPPRRGMLKPKPAVGMSEEKSRCLLVAQDREEVFLVIGEWDSMYEEYAIEGRFSDANIKKLDQLRSRGDAASDDAGFLTLNVYGPFGGYSQRAFPSLSKSMTKLSANLLALSLHLSQASCSPLSRRPTPPAPIKPPTPRGDPCCPGCTCGCGCGRPPGGPGTSEPPPGPPKPPPGTSGTRKGGQHGHREGSVPKDPSKKTPSISSNSSSSSGRPDPTPSRGPRPSGLRPDEIRAASAHVRDPRQDPGPVQAQGHGVLPMRGRPLASGQQGARSESEEQASRSRSRAQAVAAGQQGQGPAPMAASRHPPLPQVPGGPTQVVGQQRQPQQQQGQRDPRGHATSSTTQQQGGTAYDQARQRPQTRAQTAGHHSHQPYHDPVSEPGPSHPAQAGPSSQHMPATPARLELAKPSQTQQNPEDQSAKPEKKNPLSPKNFMSKIMKPKKDKKGKGPDDNNDKGDGGKK